jgi:hypothetical protein
MADQQPVEVKELLIAAKLALSIMKRFFLCKEGKGTIKRLEQAINNLEARQ